MVSVLPQKHKEIVFTDEIRIMSVNDVLFLKQNIIGNITR